MKKIYVVTLFFQKEEMFSSSTTITITVVCVAGSDEEAFGKAYNDSLEDERVVNCSLKSRNIQTVPDEFVKEIAKKL